MSHDYNIFKSLLYSLTDLAQSRFLGIIRNIHRLVEAQPGPVIRLRSHSAATSTHTKAAQHQGAVTHTLDPLHESPGEQRHHVRWQGRRTTAYMHTGH